MFLDFFRDFHREAAVSIYKPCDIRGDAAKELTPEMYHRWGYALGTQVESSEKFVVGGDTRRSTPDFLAALVEGLSQAGVDTVDLGQLPTPMVYHAKRRLKAAACAIVTASHNPVFVNGLKWMIGDRPPAPSDVESMRRIAERPSSQDHRVPKPPRSMDISFDYVANLQETWIETMNAQLNVALDPMFGSWAGKCRRYLHAIFPQCLFSTIHDVAEEDFAGQTPDCSQPALLTELGDAVYRERASLGMAFDGDGDRLALVDENGMPLSGEEAAWVLLDSFGEELRGEKFVYDLKFSERLLERARKLGAEPVAERSGHSFIRAKMVETGAIFGAEVSGHYFFRALDGGDDGFYAACRVIAHLARCGDSLGEIRRRCPAIFITPDLRLSVSRQSQAEILESVHAAWESFEHTTTDGIRIETPSGWILVRPSVTEEALTFRFESIDWDALDDLVDRFSNSLPDELGDRLVGHYAAAMGKG
jgi:phosphomannomutase